MSGFQYQSSGNQVRTVTCLEGVMNPPGLKESVLAWPCELPPAPELFDGTPGATIGGMTPPFLIPSMSPSIPQP
jgi:hypothetical protein